MAVSDVYLSFIIDQLSEFGSFQTKKMFGGVGFFRDGVMFGMIASGERFYLKVDETNLSDFQARNMHPFFSEKMQKGLPYYEVPLEILEDKVILKHWGEKAYQVALRAKKKK